MREKTLQCILSFHNTVYALQMEKLGKEKDLPGRLIPLPSVISAGCGLAWSTALENKESTLAACQEAGLDPSAVHEILF